LQQLINRKNKTKEERGFKGKRITYHDSCYLGRANNIYKRQKVLEILDAERLMTLPKQWLMLRGRRWAKFNEPGDKRINIDAQINASHNLQLLPPALFVTNVDRWR
jgi:hypothetical protein